MYALAVVALNALSFASLVASPPSCRMWLVRNNALKKITDEFATLSVCGSYVRLRIKRYRGMNHAQDFTGCSADFDDCPWSDQFAG